jgi:hypothetical protein
MATDVSGPPYSVCGSCVLRTDTTTGSVAGSFIHTSQDIPDATGQHTGTSPIVLAATGR